MKTRTALFVSCVLLMFGVFTAGCYSAGGGYNLHEESPYHLHTIETTRDSRGQPTVVETKIVKPEAQQRFMMRETGFGFGPDFFGGMSGDSHTDVPSSDTVRCITMKSGQYAGQTFCPSAQGVVPLVRSSSEPGEVAQDPYKQQTINNAAAIQELQDCVNSGGCR